MSYRELPLPNPRPQLVIDGTAYDVDYFGMDDGRSEDPTAARRFLFQLGYGYMIYLYVVQAGGNADMGWFFHTFWTKDCAVAEVEMVEHGAPRSVVGTVELPVVFDRLLVREGAQETSYVVERAAFRAEVTDGEQRLEMEFGLRHELLRGRLLWTRARGYELDLRDDTQRPLRPGETILFG